ncbi:hypothetical protein M422DRAFT_260010 [Sphaerobolus stellatus SS14]|uniref:Uncharacterized protein n=1 Tax=Sphaerobolus stellatus (strain SS14) TaxID=990650 RepID=A0A0C9VII7_SPHS4|nr:hypothetical protein M422DRAFT_260010 [Sphaerobolus stellatus SS14]
MRLFSPLVALTGFLAASVVAQDTQDVPKQKQAYQSDVARLRKIVINRQVLYSHREIFLRELVSNANDALEKLRLTALTDKSLNIGDSPLNITIKPIPDEDGPGGRLIITGSYIAPG